jgi:hypothetical protein
VAVPRLYLTPVELNELPLGVGLQGYISQLGMGVLDKMLIRASQVCDSFCQRRLGAPQSSTLALAASPGATMISATSTLGYDNLSDQVVIVGTGGTQEIMEIVSGGVAITTYTLPYPGTIALTSPLLYSHAQGETIVGNYQEVDEVETLPTTNPFRNSFELYSSGPALSSFPYECSFAHVVFLDQYPIMSISLIEYATNYSSIFSPVTSTPQIMNDAGWYRFGVSGTFWRDGLIRTTYMGGYQNIPEDIKIACSYYFAAEIEQIVNPFSAASTHMGKHSLSFSFKGKHTAAAQEILQPYVTII